MRSLEKFGIEEAGKLYLKGRKPGRRAEHKKDLVSASDSKAWQS